METQQFEDILIYFSKSLMGKVNEEDILWDLAKNCISKLGFVDCVVCIIDHETDILVQKAAYGPKNPKDRILFKPLVVSLGQGITGHVAESGFPELINDTSQDDRYIVDDEVRLSKICVPIAFENEIFGVIDCEHPEKAFFTDQHLKMLSVIASICAIKIKSVRATVALIQEQEYLLKVKEEMVELKLKALNSQLHPHFVFNVINSIQYFVTSKNAEAALEYLSLFSKLLRFNLKYLEPDVVSLQDEIQMLNWYLKLQQLRYDEQFEYEMYIEEGSKGQHAVIPSSITLTLFENLIEYAVYKQFKNEKLDVSFEISPSNVILKIKFVHNTLVSAIEYTPDYRNNIMNWEDQINLLNAAKDYGIDKQIMSNMNDGEHSGQILVKLPNLISY